MNLLLLCALPAAWADDPWAIEDEPPKAAPSAWGAPVAAPQAPPASPNAWTPNAGGWVTPPAPTNSWTPTASAPGLTAPNPAPSSGAWATTSAGTGGGAWAPSPAPSASQWTPSPAPSASQWTPSPAPSASHWTPSAAPPAPDTGAWTPNGSAWSPSPNPPPPSEAASAWSLPDAPPSVNPAWGGAPESAVSPAWGGAPAREAPTPAAPAVVYTPAAGSVYAPDARASRGCLSDLCARGDRLDVGPFDFDGLSAVADIQVGYTRAFVDGELGAARLVPVAGAAATWTTDTFSLDMPWSAQLLASPAQAWRDYNGEVVRSHGGALALNVGGLMSIGLGTGHHSQFPVIFRDADQDGVVDEGELSRADSRWTPYSFLVFTPVTFIRQVGPQLWG